MKLQRDIGVSQPTAWFMLHRIREAWADDDDGPASTARPRSMRPTSGGKRKNMPNCPSGRRCIGSRGGGQDRRGGREGSRQQTRSAPRWSRARTSETLQGLRGASNVEPGRRRLHRRGSGLQGDAGVRSRSGQSLRQRVRRRHGAHKRDRKSFWSMLKRAHKGTFHKISPKHSATLRLRVCRQAQHPGLRNASPRCVTPSPGSSGRNLLYRDLDRRQRPFLGRAGRRGSTRRNRARASVSGVAPAKSTFAVELRVGMASVDHLQRFRRCHGPDRRLLVE